MVGVEVEPPSAVHLVNGVVAGRAGVILDYENGLPSNLVLVDVKTATGKVLSKFASGKGLKLTVTVEAAPEGGISSQKVEETKVALWELGMNDDLTS